MANSSFSSSSSCFESQREAEVELSLGKIPAYRLWPTNEKQRANLLSRNPRRRFYATNHKTGTFLAACLRRFLIHSYGIAVWEVASLSSGGFDPTALQLNHVRDPFVAIDSGYVYHARGPEYWTKLDLADVRCRGRPASGECAAKAAWLYWTRCFGTAKGNYADILKRLSTRDGLLLEAARALHRDIPFIVSSAHDCNSMLCACVNVDLDALMRDYEAGFLREIAGAWRLEDDINATTNGLNNLREAAARFAANCNPQRTNDHQQQQQQQQHLTFGTPGRLERIQTLHDLDRTYLGGAISAANRSLAIAMDRRRRSCPATKEEDRRRSADEV